jgi:Holliday junction resolvase RusA-like endonuclease
MLGVSNRCPPRTVVLFTVPGKPVAKQRPRAFIRGGRARVYTPSETASYESLVKVLALDALGPAFAPLDEPCILRVWVNCDIPGSWSQKRQREARDGTILPIAKPDLDNVVKSICDALNGVVYRDDSRVTSLIVEKRYSARGASVEVQVLRRGAAHAEAQTRDA